MDATTLVTFLFRAPLEAHTVELFGSWDNFQRSYPMLHDRRRGKGFWSGCFTFDNIVFDGDSLNWSKPRHGGLKQGGTYWYFYRLNDDAEAYDDTQSYTTSCPLLPGQRLNMIEVPMEVVDAPSRCVSAGGNTAEDLARAASVQTLNPASKFAPLAPPPWSKVHGRCHSDLAVNGRLENRPHSSKVRRMSPPVSPSNEETHQASTMSQRRGRIYGCDGYDLDGKPERQDSFDSHDTWCPETRSFVSSSAADVQARAFSRIGSKPGQLYSLPEMPSPRSGPATRVSYEEDVAPEFCTQDPFHDFDEQHADFDDDDFDALVKLPPSTPNDNDQLQSSPRRNAFDDEVHEYHEMQRHFGEHLSKSSHMQSSTTSPRPSGEHRADSEANPFDILSPSFSAATMSSAGLSTPFQLSAGCSRPASFHTPENKHEATMEHVTAELGRLRSSYSDSAAISPPMYQRKDPSMSGYSLPPINLASSNVDGHERDVSLLSKTSLATSSVSVVSKHETGLLPAWEMPNLLSTEGGTSFADNVFSELTFFR